MEPMATSEQPQSRRWLIVVAAVVVVCCLCALVGVVGWGLYTYGDQLLLGLGVRLGTALL